MNNETEQALLGCILIDDSVIQELTLTKDDFINKDNVIIFSSIDELRKKGTPIDLITVKDILEGKNLLERVGGMTALVELTEMVPTTSNFTTYQQTIKNASNLRQVSMMGNKILDGIKKGECADNIIGSVYASLSSIEEGLGSTTKDIADILEDTLDYIETIKNTNLIGLPFGSQFKWLDVMTGGIQPGYIYRIGGGSNIGKSYLLYNILISVLQEDDRVTFFALENEDKFTMKNLLGLKKGVNSLPAKIKKHNYNFTDELMWFNEKPNFRIDSTHKNLHEIFRSALKNKSKYIFIDYIQAIDIPGRFNNDVQKYAYYSLELQKFATKYGVAVIDLSQLSNESQKGGTFGAGSGEFKGGGSLKESCDVGLHIYANSAFVGEKSEENFYKNFVQVKLSKNRLGGGVGSCKDYIIDFDAGGKYEYNDL